MPASSNAGFWTVNLRRGDSYRLTGPDRFVVVATAANAVSSTTVRHEPVDTGGDASVMGKCAECDGMRRPVGVDLDRGGLRATAPTISRGAARAAARKRLRLILQTPDGEEGGNEVMAVEDGNKDVSKGNEGGDRFDDVLAHL